MNEKRVLQRTVSYDEGLLKALKDPEEARAYLEVPWVIVRLLRQ